MGEPGRRRALVWVVRGLSAALTALYAIPAVRYLAGRPAPPAPTVDLGPLSALPEGVPQRVVLPSTQPDAWRAGAAARQAIFLVRNGQAVRALDTTCPHTGCAVEWDAAQTRFRCPCHRSAFGPDGARLAGPAPRDLDPQEVTVEAGRVRVRYRRYRAGRPDRVPT